MPITIEDVARRARVGVSTVSRVLNNPALVAAATRERVRQVIAETGFTPDPVARRRGPTRTLTLAVVGTDLTDPSADERLRGILSILPDHPLTLLIHALPAGRRYPNWLRRLLAHRPDGLLMLPGGFDARELTSVRDAELPLVTIDVHVEGDWPRARVVHDCAQGARMAVDHLIRLGHRRIAFLAQDTVTSAVQPPDALLRDGFLTALRAARIRTQSGPIVSCPPTIWGGRLAARALFQKRQPPTAIFTAHSLQALGVLLAAEDLGLHIPRDCSLISWADDEALVGPGVTTVGMRPFESGRRGAELLLRVIEERPAHMIETVLDPVLSIHRTTTAPSSQRD